MKRDRLLETKMDFNDILWMTSGVAVILLVIMMASFFIIS